MKIVTDCAAYLLAEELEKFGITQAPLYIRFPEGELSATEIDADDFYNRLEAMRPAIPTTAQPSSGLFESLYRELAQTDQTILSIHISSGLSGTLDSARLGAEHAAPQANVTAWDTLTLSGGERYQVLAAALGQQAGWSMAAIQERLAAIRAQTELAFTLETLEYLERGGRIGRVQALLGSLLKLKPVITVEHADGKYNNLAKCRTIPQALTIITEHFAEIYQQTPVWTTVFHGRFLTTAETLARQLGEKLNIARLEMTRISPVLGVHTGPGTVGAVVMPMKLMEDLL
jgi:DegV family protein with EDD domain